MSASSNQSPLTREMGAPNPNLPISELTQLNLEHRCRIIQWAGKRNLAEALVVAHFFDSNQLDHVIKRFSPEQMRCILLGSHTNHQTVLEDNLFNSFKSKELPAHALEVEKVIKKPLAMLVSNFQNKYAANVAGGTLDAVEVSARVPVLHDSVALVQKTASAWISPCTNFTARLIRHEDATQSSTDIGRQTYRRLVFSYQPRPALDWPFQPYSKDDRAAKKRYEALLMYRNKVDKVNNIDEENGNSDYCVDDEPVAAAVDTLLAPPPRQRQCDSRHTGNKDRASCTESDAKECCICLRPMDGEHCLLEVCNHTICTDCAIKLMDKSSFADPDLDEDTDVGMLRNNTFLFERAGACPICRKLPTEEKSWVVVNPKKRRQTNRHQFLVGGKKRVGHWAYVDNWSPGYISQGYIDDKSDLWDAMMIYYRPDVTNGWASLMIKSSSTPSDAQLGLMRTLHRDFMKQQFVVSLFNKQPSETRQCSKCHKEVQWYNLLLWNQCSVDCVNKHMCICCGVLEEVNQLLRKCGGVAAEMPHYLKRNPKQRPKCEQCNRGICYLRRLDNRKLRCKDDPLGWSYEHVKDALVRIRSNPADFRITPSDAVLTCLDADHFFTLEAPHASTPINTR